MNRIRGLTAFGSLEPWAPPTPAEREASRAALFRKRVVTGKAKASEEAASNRSATQ